MNSSRLPLSGLVVAGAASLILSLAACSSDTDTTANTGSASASSTAAASCPSAEPEAGDPEWTFDGDTGKVSVIGSTDSAAPLVDIEAPFSVAETTVQTLNAGDGQIVADDSSVSVCYVGVNGRDGSVFDSSYESGSPVEFPLGRVVPGFQKAIAGQTVGSTVAVAMTSGDGYADGNPSAGIEAGDSLVFAIKILGVSG